MHTPPSKASTSVGWTSDRMVPAATPAASNAVIAVIRRSLLCAYALHPGGIRTNIQRYVSAEELARLRAELAATISWKTPEQGAATSVLLATSPLVEGIGGRYFDDCNEALPSVPGEARGVAAYALDPEAAARLWQVSTDLI